MALKMLSVFVSLLLIQQICGLTRVEIRSQFQPTLLRLREVASSKYLEINREYETLINQLNKHQNRSKNSTQTQIDNIKKTLADAKKSPNVTSLVLNCFKAQEANANRLSVAPLNACYKTTDATNLRNVRDRLTILANVASNTVNFCENLNPLETQLEAYSQCLADKVPDLNRQINIVESQYRELSNTTLQNNINCLTDNAGSVLGQISVISYEINICFFSPL